MRIAKLGLRVPALVFILFLGGYGTANAQLQAEESANPERTDESDRRRYTFTWQFEESGRLAPRRDDERTSCGAGSICLTTDF